MSVLVRGCPLSWLSPWLSREPVAKPLVNAILRLKGRRTEGSLWLK